MDAIYVYVRQKRQRYTYWTTGKIIIEGDVHEKIKDVDYAVLYAVMKVLYWIKMKSHTKRYLILVRHRNAYNIVARYLDLWKERNWYKTDGKKVSHEGMLEMIRNLLQYMKTKQIEISFRLKP